MYFDEVCWLSSDFPSFVCPFLDLDLLYLSTLLTVSVATIQNGWPSVTSKSVQPNSPDAVADIPNEQEYYVLLDQHCEDLKAVVGGGVGWFAHIYSDNQEPGYGIYNSKGQMKIAFGPRTEC